MGFDDMNLDPRVAEYMRKKQEAEQGMDRANLVSNVSNVGESAINALTNKPAIFENRMQDLGQAPKISQGAEVKLDTSGLQEQAREKLKSASHDAGDAVKVAFEQRKAQLAAQVEEKKAEREKAYKDREYEQNERKMAADAKLKQRELELKAEIAKNKPTDPLMGLLRKEQLEKLTKENNQPSKLPVEDQKVVETLATKNAGKISIANQIDSYLTEFQKAPDKATKLRVGGQMLKVLNSPEGADAIGVEEARRLGDALDFQMFNVFGAGPMFGRDLGGFESQVKSTSEAVKGGVKTNQAEISRLTGRGAKPAATRDYNSMSDAELEALLQQGE